MVSDILKRPYAVVDWTQSGPVARTADDIYFSNEDGLAEAREVFVKAAGFPERFSPSRPTVVAELGFGTGLNFLALWDAFRRQAPADARLHFVSVEGFPLHRDDAKRALEAFPELAGLADCLIRDWPSPHKGAHRRVFEGGRVMLTLFHDGVAEALPNMEFQADAWFLDGFAPAKNPDMWADDLFAQIARLSRPSSAAVTFTVAGAVRRGLAGVGFDVEKKPGFGRKRERLEAIYEGAPSKAAPSPFPLPRHIDGPITIIGGGIAAASLVHAFSLRGRKVDVFAKGGWAQGASGAPCGLLTPRLEAADRPHNRALMAAFDYAAALYAETPGFDRTGVARLATDAKSAARLQRLCDHLDERYDWVDPDAAHHRFGLGAADGAMFINDAGIHTPSDVIAALVKGQRPYDAQVARVQRSGDGWTLTSSDQANLGEYAGVILAGGWASASMTALPLEPTAGRIGVFENPSDFSTPAAWGGYAAPFEEDVVIGATHLKSDDPGDDGQAEAELRHLAQTAPGAGVPVGVMKHGWGAVRAALPDRLPVMGAMPTDTFDAQWGQAARGGPWPNSGEYASNSLMVLGGLGARGFAHAPLLAETLVSAILAEPLPLEHAGLENLHPARLRWRHLRRGS